MAPTQRCSRRKILQQGLAAATAALTAPRILAAQVLGRAGRHGANSRVQVGVIGTGSRGKYLISNLPEAARVAAICDCFQPRVADTLNPAQPFAAPLARFRQTDAATCATYQDYRQMLARERLDAVIIATPDHHHVLAAMLACQAGLDIYLEKPLTLTIAEGRRLVQAVQRSGRVLQVGSQQRSMEWNRFGCDFIRRGDLGRVSLVQLPNDPGPKPVAALPAEPVPAGLDWDLFCGPTPVRPHNPKLWVKDEFQVDGKLWRGWDLWRDYSGHLLTNWGAHYVDMVQLALGMDQTGPVEIWPLLEGFRGERQACPVAMRYATGIEVQFTPQVTRWTFHGERGRLAMVRNRVWLEPAELLRDPPDPKLAERWQGPGNVARPHLQNWLDCIQSRQTPAAPVEAGHRTATICHLVNLARELGRKLRWDPVREQFPDDDQANALLDRPRRKGFELPTG